MSRREQPREGGRKAALNERDEGRRKPHPGAYAVCSYCPHPSATQEACCC